MNETRNRTHWETCYDTHPECLVARLERGADALPSWLFGTKAIMQAAASMIREFLSDIPREG